MKKITSVILALLIALSTMPFTGIEAFADGELTTGPCGDYAQYSFDSDSATLTISGTGDMTDYTMNSPFQGNTQIEKVVIESGITSVGNYAFYQCAEINQVTLPESLTEIKANAFGYCSKLETINMDKVETISAYAFSNCSSLSELTLPDSLLSISENAFQNCTALTEITIPANVEGIGFNAFSGCTSLTGITFLSKTCLIYNGEYTIPETATIYGLASSTAQTYAETYNRTFVRLGAIPCGESINGYLDEETGLLEIIGTGEMTSYDSSTSPFYNNKTIKSVVIGNGVTGISSYAFSGCSNITSINIPDSVTYIQNLAFNGCSGLTSITIPKNLTTVFPDAFKGCTGLTEINVDEGNTLLCSENGILFNKEKTEIVKYPAGKSGTDYTIPAGVTVIDDFAFCDCSKLRNVTVHDNVETIGNSAFYGCSGLNSVNLPSDLSSINQSLFNGCTNLSSIEIPETVTIIGSSAFAGCRNLTDIDIPDGVTNIGSFAFSDCRSLTDIEIPGGVSNIDKCTFKGCSNLTSVTIKKGVKSIDFGAFRDCVNLTDVSIPASVTTIGKNFLLNYVIYGGAFEGCTSLESITIPENAQLVGRYSFRDCTSLEEIVVLSSFCTIYDEAVTVPEGATIYGLKNSGAQSYANKYNRTFVQLCSNGSKEHSYTRAVTDYSEDSVEYTYTCSLCGFKYTESSSRFATGSCGDNAQYSFDRATQTLEITGTGALYNYAEANIPIKEFAAEVKNLNVSSDITIPYLYGDFVEEDTYFLNGCTNIEMVNAPCSVIGIFGIDETGAEFDPNDLSIDYTERMPSIKKLKSLTVTGTGSISRYQFNNYQNLENVTLGSGITGIEIGAFANCPKLSAFTVLNDECSLDNVLEYTIYGDGGPETNKHVPAVASPAIKAHVNSLAKTYASGKGLTFVALCNDGTENHNFSKYDRYCLNGCGAENPNYDSAHYGRCGINAFWEYDDESATLTVSGTGVMYNSQEWSALAAKIEYAVIEDGITNIGAGVFAGCSKLCSVTIPDSVTAIGANAFKNCVSLRSIEVPATVTTLGSGAFDGCTKLISVNYKGNADNWNNLVDDETADVLKKSAVVCNDTQIIDDNKFTVQNETLYSADKKILVKIIEDKAVDEYEIPATVTEVTEGAFENLSTDLIIINSNMKALGSKLFGNEPGNDTPSTIFVYSKHLSLKMDTFYLGEENGEANPDSPARAPSQAAYPPAMSATVKTNMLMRYVVDGNTKKKKLPTIYCLYDTSSAKTTYMQCVKTGRKTLAYVKPSAYTYKGSQIKPVLKVYDASINRTVQSGTCYTTSFGKNINSGTGYVYITGAGSYRSVKTRSAYRINFTIKRKKITKAKLEKTVYDYNGKVRKPALKYYGKKSYSAVYPKNGNVGEKSVKITFKGNYSGTVYKKYKILPKGSYIFGLNAPKKQPGTVTVKWKKQVKQNNGYIIQYSTNKNFSKKKTVTVKGAAANTCTLTGLEQGKRYYVRIRTYKKANGKTFRSKWSKRKSVKVKKVKVNKTEKPV